MSTIDNDDSYKWTEVTMDAAFAPRDGAGGLVFNGKMWLIGGWNPLDKEHFPSICTNDVWSSTDGAEWNLEKPNTFGTDAFDPVNDWEGRHTAGYVIHDGKMWIVGGDCNQGHHHGDIWHSSDGRNWQRPGPSNDVPWAPRVLHHTVSFNDRIWVIGGQTMPDFVAGAELFYDDVWSTADGVNWEQTIPASPRWPQRGMIGGCAVFNDRMWLLGGGTYDTPKIPARKVFNDVWSSADGEHWECHTEEAAWAPRQYHEVAVFDAKLWVMEGYNPDSHNRNDVWYSADGVNWHEVPNTPWKPRHAATVFVYDNAMWMVTGNNMESDAWKLTRN